MQVQLSRDALSTAWGFRLQGGRDFKTPLTVQRVFVGSPAEGELHRGDVIMAIENYDATQMIHKQAQDLIKSSGGSITLTVRRGAGGGRPMQTSYAPQVCAPTPKHYGSAPQSFRSRPLDVKPSAHSMPQQQSYGIDYSRARVNRPHNPGSMLNKVQESLTTTIMEPGALQGEEDYNYKPVSELTHIFKSSGQNPTHHLSGAHQPKRGGWKRPDPAASGIIGGGLKEPGWSPGAQRAASGWNSVKAPTNARPSYAPQQFNQPSPPYQPAQVPHQQPPQQLHTPMVNRPQPHQEQFRPPHIEEPSTPAWAGSLKSSSSTKPWEVHAATALTGEGPAPYQGVVHESPLAPPPIQRQASPMSATAAVHNPRVQSVHYAPGQSPVYQQHDANEPSATARVVHLQYQSPLGLYSKENAQVALDAQTKGKPGEGTLAVMDADQAAAMQSDVYKMVHENDTRQHGAPQADYGRADTGQHYEMNNGYGEMDNGLGASDF